MQPAAATLTKCPNYCRSCKYKPTVKNGPKACPFNYLYWDFVARNDGKLRGNPRMGFMYKSLDRMNGEKRQAIQDDSRQFFNALQANEKV